MKNIIYKKITKNEKITRKITDVHLADNYLTKETTKNISLATNKLDGNFDFVRTVNERILYFISVNVDFIIDNEQINFEDGNVLYLSKGTNIMPMENLKQLSLILLILEQ